MKTKVQKGGNNLALGIAMTLHNLVSRITGNNIHREIESGTPIGREVW